MGKINEFLRRLRYFLSRRRRSRELDDEMAFHREMVERSGSPECGRSFGNAGLLREQAREAWGWTWIDRLGQDLRYAARMLARSPGFTSTAVLVLALGIGSNIFMFSTMDWAFFKYLPVRDPNSLVRLQRHATDNYSYAMPYPTAVYYRDHARTLSAVMTWASGRLELDPDAKAVSANYVSANYFKELGASAAYGRLLDSALDDARSESPAVVLGHDFWQRYFNADPAVVGRTIRLNHQPATIVGVELYGFPGLGNSGDTVDVWISITQQPYLVSGSKMLTATANGAVMVWGRLAPGVTGKMAEQELLGLTDERRKLYPKEIWKGEDIHIDPAGHSEVLDARAFQALSIVSALGLLILIMTCANLGGLLLARGVARAHEVAIRIAIGANSRRIFRQLFTESLLLALLGAAAGLALACAALKACLLYFGRPTWVSAAPDWRVCVLLLGMGFVAAIFFGLAPALQLARQQQKRTLARQVLIAVQVAANCLLVIVSSLLVRSAQHAIFTDPGFGYEQIISIDPGFREHGYSSAVAQAYLDKLESRLRVVPGIASVSLVKYPPFSGGWIVNSDIKVHQLAIYRNWVEAEFFRTMDIPVLLGRSFTPGEKNAVIVSESLARKQWPGENPLGKIYWEKNVVVGVVGNAPINTLKDDGSVQLYSPVQLDDMPEMNIVLKSSGAPDGFIPMLKSMVQGLDPKLFPEIRLLKSAFRQNMQSAEELALIMSLIGMAAMLLAGVGILGLVGYAVSQRTKEIAIRLALGSSKVQVAKSILRQFLWPVLLGVVGGAGSAAALSQILRRLLSGVSGLDPLSYVVAIAMLLGIFVLAAVPPARRALRLDVARALHQE
jgi:predicted permease